MVDKTVELHVIGINQRYFEKYCNCFKIQWQQAAEFTFCRYEGMKVYTLLLKQKSTACFPMEFCGILEQFFLE